MTFHRNSLKLAGLYLAVIMSISLFFSVSLYNVSMQELNRGLRGPGPRSVIEELPNYEGSIRQLYEQERKEQLENARNRVLRSLFITNLFIFVGAGFLSYYLAYRTLRPIEEAHEAQARFTADASHELRTPIAVMQTETEVALMDSKLSLKEAKAQLRSNLEELAKLTSLTESLLGLAQYEGDQKPGVSKILVDDVLQEAVRKIRVTAAQKNITITIPTTNNAMILVNKELTTEVLFIVLDNAVKYSDKNTEITIAVRSVNKQVSIDVTDHGQGIRASDLPHIFDRFYRADAARSKQNVAGYGLGLSLAMKIMTLQNGTISAKSTVGQGSVFTIIVPTA